MRELRRYVQDETKVSREHLYGSYCKQGISKDGHKAIKLQGAQENS